MQNKYKIPSDVRGTVINIVKGYDRRAAEIKARESEICSIGGGHYESYTVGSGEERRTYTPKGKGGTSAPVEHQADRLAYYHATDRNYLLNKTVEDALNALTLDKYDEAEKIKKEIFDSCRYYRKHPFIYSEINEISEKTFYNLRAKFLYILAKKLKFI